jgi:hypothetical protein
MDAAKLRPDLSTRLAQAEADDVLDVVLELDPQTEPDAPAPQSRREQIALRKETFDNDVVPVEEAINESGGKVVARAWINNTVLARVPARGVEQLSELDKVAALDVPRTIEAEVG